MNAARRLHAIATGEQRAVVLPETHEPRLLQGAAVADIVDVIVTTSVEAILSAIDATR